MFQTVASCRGVEEAVAAGTSTLVLGDFDGVTSDGTPIHLLFPASLRVSGDDLLATNLALDRRLFDSSFAAVDSEWCAHATRYTISRIRVLSFAKNRSFTGRGCRSPKSIRPCFYAAQWYR